MRVLVWTAVLSSAAMMIGSALAADAPDRARRPWIDLKLCADEEARQTEAYGGKWHWESGKYCDHAIVLDKDGLLLPWTTYDNILKGSMKFIEQCPTVPTKYGDDPWYMVTSALTDDGKFMRNQNCQGNHAYMGVETLTRYYAYSGDEAAIVPIRRILDRVLLYHTPADWAWPNVPRTQDNSPDGEYTDTYSEPDKIAAAGVAYIKFYKLTGEEKYLEAARGIAKTIASHVAEGNADASPLPFRVSLQDGKVLVPYTSHIVASVLLLDEMVRLGETGDGVYQAKRDLLRKWVLDYPVKNRLWANYYEDVKDSTQENRNQHSPMETARFMLQRPELDPDYRQHVPALLAWVKDRFGKARRHGATSIREQDGCFSEMGSHTARYASIAAMWFGASQDPQYREEAKRSFAVASYSAFSKYSHDDVAINYVGLGYVRPWFTDSYFDYLTHILDGMREMPEMAPADADHIVGSDSIVKKVTYQPGRIEYTTFEPQGNEILRVTFQPKTVTADGKELPVAKWSYGEYRGVPGVLQIHRDATKNVVIAK